jgi:WD40 repeat protein
MTLLASASYDRTIKLWAFESRQLLTSFDVTSAAARCLVLSPDSRKLAYTTFNASHKIHICDVPPDILTNVWPGQEALTTSVCTHPCLSMSIHLSRIDIIYRHLQVHMLVIHSTYAIHFFHSTPPLIIAVRCNPPSCYRAP